MSEPNHVSFTLTTGSTPLIRLIWTDGGGQPLNLTGAKIWIAIKQTQEASDASALVFVNSEDDASQFDLTNAITGVVDVRLTRAQTLALDTGESPLYHVEMVKLSDGTYEFPSDGQVVIYKGGIEAA